MDGIDGMDVALVTDAQHVGFADDAEVLIPALAARGITARDVAWDAPAANWAAPRLCVLRATWDYHLRRDEFLTWAERVAALIPLWNPIAVVRWNTHKAYLRDLEARGVPIVPTLWLARGTEADLATLLRTQEWEAAVLKPAVSASAHETRLIRPPDLSAGQAHLDRLLRTGDVLAQPFLRSILTYRERSLMFVDGAHTHATQRRPSLDLAPADEPEFDLIAATSEEVAFAHHALSQVREAGGRPLLYARVDLVRDDEGSIRLLELEATEPGLALMAHPPAGNHLADAIVRRLDGGM